MSTDNAVGDIQPFVNYRRIGEKDRWRAGRLTATGVAPVQGGGHDRDEPALYAVEHCRDDSTTLVEPAETLSGIEIGPPVLRPSKIVAAAANYSDHASEMPGDRGTITRQGFFLKAPSSMVSSGGTIRLPFPDRRTDFEGELAVVIGRRARDLTETDALEAVLGYTCLLDISLRGEEDRGFRKSFDTFTPIGPGIVPAADVADLDASLLTTTVNGEVRQQARLSQMILRVPALLAWISSAMTLEPGDVIATGTPQGVGPLTPGDAVRVQITGVGVLDAEVALR